MKARQSHMSSYEHMFKGDPKSLEPSPQGRGGLVCVLSSIQMKGWTLGWGVADSYVLSKHNFSPM